MHACAVAMQWYRYAQRVTLSTEFIFRLSGYNFVVIELLWFILYLRYASKFIIKFYVLLVHAQEEDRSRVPTRVHYKKKTQFATDEYTLHHIFSVYAE